MTKQIKHGQTPTGGYQAGCRCKRCLDAYQLDADGRFKPATWPVGALVEVDGVVSGVVESEKLPDNACALIQVPDSL